MVMNFLNLCCAPTVMQSLLDIELPFIPPILLPLYLLHLADVLKVQSTILEKVC